MKTLEEWQSQKTKELQIPTCFGLKKIKELHHIQPDFSLISKKLNIFSEKISKLFPEHALLINKLITIFKMSEDSLVLQTFADVPETVSFEKINNPQSLETMFFSPAKNCVIMNEPFVQDCLSTPDRLYPATIFMRNILHELTHAVQHKFGVANTDLHHAHINIMDATTLHFMKEIDAKLVEMRFCDEILSPHITAQTNLSDDSIFQEYIVQHFLIPNHEMLSVDTVNNLVTKKMLLYFTEFPTNMEEYNSWQKFYAQQITDLLTQESKVYPSITTGTSSEIAKYKLDYYYSRYPELETFKNSLQEQYFAKRLVDAFKLYEQTNHQLELEKCLYIYDLFHSNTKSPSEKIPIQKMLKGVRCLMKNKIPIEQAQRLFEISWERE